MEQGTEKSQNDTVNHLAMLTNVGADGEQGVNGPANIDE
jgi:hypothetical protein